MGIKKQEYYEGAALHLLARSGGIAGIAYHPPLFLLNDAVLLHLKYSTKGRSPWAFTFTPDEQRLLRERASGYRLVIAFVCGSDGVAAIEFEELAAIAEIRESALAVSCRRKHREHYEIRGPDGKLSQKVAPSDLQRILKS